MPKHSVKRESVSAGAVGRVIGWLGTSTACYFCGTDEPNRLEYEYSPELDAYVCENCRHKLVWGLSADYGLRWETG
ncbi:MAG: hypothetical protein JXQ27_17995 [Acidobacteria bacterium]|nr:hypothetical protein [Acidobacteriota bacterium]